MRTIKLRKAALSQDLFDVSSDDCENLELFRFDISAQQSTFLPHKRKKPKPKIGGSKCYQGKIFTSIIKKFFDFFALPAFSEKKVSVRFCRSWPFMGPYHKTYSDAIWLECTCARVNFTRQTWAYVSSQLEWKHMLSLKTWREVLTKIQWNSAWWSFQLWVFSSWNCPWFYNWTNFK